MIIDGKDINQLFGVELKADIDYPLQPEIRRNLTEVSSGSINLGSKHGERQVIIPCVIRGKDPFQRLQEFARVFLDYRGELKEVMIQFPFTPNKRIKCILAESLRINNFHPGKASFNLTLIAPYPFYESVNETNIYRETITNSISIPINYFGTKSTGFTVSLFGKVGTINFTLISPNGNKSFSYSRITGDTYLVIDFNEFSINDNGNNGLRSSSGHFLELDQSVTALRMNGDFSVSCSILFREKYVI